MGIFSIFSFGWRRQIFKLRKSYDRVREKADKTSDKYRRLTVLRILDQVEPTLVMLEEQRISRFDRPRLVNSVKMNVEQGKMILKQKRHIPQQYQQGYGAPGAVGPPPALTKKPIRY
ncbi:MAG: hypothetical protein ABIA21_02725 [Candidatus Aenigmatarchaeota archaeon]